jgi:amylosucrase
LESGDEIAVDYAIQRILLLNSLIMSFGGIPLLYYGDEIGTLNDYSFLEDVNKHSDSRWAHRPKIDWDKAELRHQSGTVEQRIFTAIKKMIAVRKEIPAFADFNNRELIQLDNSHLFIFSRFNLRRSSSSVLVVCNLDVHPQYLDLDELSQYYKLNASQVKDLYSGEQPALFKDQLVIPPCRFYWLCDS